MSFRYNFLLFSLAMIICLGPEATNAQCLSRDTIKSRGESWVNSRVSYSQSGSYNGYRTDCSGFVSMCWGLPKPGASTSGIGSYSTRITKNDLMLGDAIVCPGQHVVLFVEWTDSKKLSYIGMEEANSRLGTVKRTITYPFFDNKSCYYPIRYKNIC